MITLFAIMIIGVIVGITYLETGRQEIQKYQEALERENNILQAKIAEQEKIRHEEAIKHIGEGEI
jgi:hypothetical protein